jgi:hypothetical protein
MMVLSLLLPALELALLFLAALFNQSAGSRWPRYQRVELLGLAALWYLVLFVGVLLLGGLRSE